MATGKPSSGTSIGIAATFPTNAERKLHSLYIYIQGESEMCGLTLGMSSTYPNKKTCSYKYGSAKASFPSYSTERTHLQELLKMSSMRLNTCLGTSHRGLSKPFKDPGIAADSLTGFHNSLVNVVNRSCIHETL
jgi:hypothetical protein